MKGRGATDEGQGATRCGEEELQDDGTRSDRTMRRGVTVRRKTKKERQDERTRSDRTQ